jgi:cell wall-associated NlpC family hydrolase
MTGVSITAGQIVAEARTWIGTRFHHAAAKKGLGVDCIGLILGVCRALRVEGDETQYRVHATGYGRQADGKDLRAGCDERFLKIHIGVAKPGDIFMADIGLGRPHHIGFFGDYLHRGLSMIHALGPAPPAKVVEHRMDNTWRGRIVAVYRIPGVEE